MKTVTKVLLGGMLCVFATSPFAQVADYPTRSIEITVPYGAGGATDVVARRLATFLEKELGQTIVVLNRPGAQGTLQAGQLARAKPDGYTLGVLGYSALTYVPQLMSNTPYEIDDFSMVGGIGSYSYGIVAAKGSPIKTVKDMLEASKRPEGLTYAVTGAPNNVPFVRLARDTGGTFEEITYGSGAESVTAAAAGHVDVALQNPPDFLPLLQNDKIQLIASATDKPILGYEDVPTLIEEGYDIVVVSAIGLAAPKGLPEDISEKLQNALLKAVQEPEFVKFMQTQHMNTLPLDGPEFRQMVLDGYDEMGQLIKELDVPMIN